MKDAEHRDPGPSLVSRLPATPEVGVVGGRPPLTPTEGLRLRVPGRPLPPTGPTLRGTRRNTHTRTCTHVHRHTYEVVLTHTQTHVHTRDLPHSLEYGCVRGPCQLGPVSRSLRPRVPSTGSCRPSVTHRDPGRGSVLLKQTEVCVRGEGEVCPTEIGEKEECRDLGEGLVRCTSGSSTHTHGRRTVGLGVGSWCFGARVSGSRMFSSSLSAPENHDRLASLRKG